MTYPKIENGIPIPQRVLDGSRSDFLLRMSPGQSIKIDQKTRAGWVCSSKRAGVKVTTRQMEDGSIRLWVLPSNGDVKT